jgi:hypothetical protein
MASISIAPLFSDKKDTTKIRELLHQTKNPSDKSINTSLKTASQQRLEHETLKNELQRYHLVKDRHLHAIKAERVLRSEWKYGLIGGP